LFGLGHLLSGLNQDGLLVGVDKHYDVAYL